MPAAGIVTRTSVAEAHRHATMERRASVHHSRSLADILPQSQEHGACFAGYGYASATQCVFERPHAGNGLFQQLTADVQAIEINRIPLFQRLPDASPCVMETLAREGRRHDYSFSTPPLRIALDTRARLNWSESTWYVPFWYWAAIWPTRWDCVPSCWLLAAAMLAESEEIWT
jgi:hypothetical protein